MFCQQQGWMGVEPYCDLDPSSAIEVSNTSEEENEAEDDFEACEYDHGCEYKCKMLDDVPTCICQEGYRIHDVTACMDIDECVENNGGCQHDCINKPGTFECKQTINHCVFHV